MELAATLMDAPLAFFTVVDAERSWYHAAVGIPQDLSSGAVEGSFCKYVITSTEPLVVGDAAADVRTTGNRALAEMGVRAWAGHPVRDPDGQILGSFCVVDTTPRARVEESRTELDALRARQYQVLELLQRSLLPTTVPWVAGLDVAVRYESASRASGLGGDWYDVIELADSRVALVIADVAGHDAQAVATMAQLRPSLHAFARDALRLSEVLGRLHRLMVELGASRFLTAFYGTWDPTNSSLRFQSAEHPPLILASSSRDTEICTAGRPGLLGTSALTPGSDEHRSESVESIADALMREASPSTGWDDDVALLVGRCHDRPTG